MAVDRLPNKYWMICDRTEIENGLRATAKAHTYSHTRIAQTHHSRHAYRFRACIFPNLFGRLSKDDEIIYTKCILTNDERTHITATSIPAIRIAFVATGNARKFSSPNIEGHVRSLHCSTRDAATSRRSKHAKLIVHSLCTFGERAFHFYLFNLYFFFCADRIENVRANVVWRERASFTRQWNFKRWHVCRARAFQFKHRMTGNLLFFSLSAFSSLISFASFNRSLVSKIVGTAIVAAIIVQLFLLPMFNDSR